MKKYLIGILVMMFVFTGCNNKTEEEVIALEDMKDSQLISALTIETKDLRVVATSNFNEDIINTVVYYKGSDVKISFDYPDFIYNNMIVYSDGFTYNKVADETYGYKTSFDNFSINNLMVNVVNLKGNYTALVSTVDGEKVILVSYNDTTNGNNYIYNAVYSFEYGIPLSIELLGAEVSYEYSVVSIKEEEVSTALFDIFTENYMSEEEYDALQNNEESI